MSRKSTAIESESDREEMMAAIRANAKKYAIETIRGNATIAEIADQWLYYWGIITGYYRLAQNLNLGSLNNIDLYVSRFKTLSNRLAEHAEARDIDSTPLIRIVKILPSGDMPTTVWDEAHTLVTRLKIKSAPAAAMPAVVPPSAVEKKWVPHDEIVTSYMPSKTALCNLIKENPNWARKLTQDERRRPRLKNIKLLYDLYAIQHYRNMRD